jgi:hypothetical protein
MEPDEAHITIKAPGIDVDKAVSAEIAADVLRLVLTGKVSVGSTSGLHHSESGEPPETLAEFMREVDPKRNPDKIATIAKYLKNTGHPTFSRTEAREAFREARETEPGNYARDFKWAQYAGWIGGNDASGFYLTRTGETAVNSRFSGEAVEKSKGKFSGRRRSVVHKTAVHGPDGEDTAN